MSENIGFFFYRSFRDAVTGLPESDRLIIYNALFDYGLDNKEPENLNPYQAAIFTALKPNIKNQPIKKGGAPRNNQNARRPQPKPIDPDEDYETAKREAKNKLLGGSE